MLGGARLVVGCWGPGGETRRDLGAGPAASSGVRFFAGRAYWCGLLGARRQNEAGWGRGPRSGVASGAWRQLVRCFALFWRVGWACRGSRLRGVRGRLALLPCFWHCGAGCGVLLLSVASGAGAARRCCGACVCLALPGVVPSWLSEEGGGLERALSVWVAGPGRVSARA